MPLKQTGRILLLSLCAVVFLSVTHAVWFRWMGEYLVRAEEPAKADAVLVLAGDWNGDRILKGAEVVKQGYAPVVLVSGPMPIYGINEATLAIDYAVKHGYPRDIFIPMISTAFSTRDEADYFERELRKRGIRRLLVVTGDFHTHRAGSLFRRKLGPDFDIRMVASPDRHFTPGGWWKNREGRKTFFFEWSKTIATFIER